MPGLLSLPPELLHEIIQICPGAERCRLRATCKILTELADPIVFRRLRLYALCQFPDITEHQIVSLASCSSKACEFTRDLEILGLPDRIQPTEQSWGYFGDCNDLRSHLPTAILTLKNLTRFSWIISADDPGWLIDSLMHAAASLPHLDELDVYADDPPDGRIAYGDFANLSKISVTCAQNETTTSFISQISTVIASSPELKSLDVIYFSNHPLPTLDDLFAKVPTNNPLRLEHLSIDHMDATLNQSTLPHLMHLTSFRFVFHTDHPIARSVWTSFLVHNIKLSDVEIEGIITEEAILYLSSFSGLKRLCLGATYGSFPNASENLKNLFYTIVLPKHVDSLRTLDLPEYLSSFDYTNSTSIIKCLKLRDLIFHLGEKESDTPVQLLDAVAHLPELNILACFRGQYSQAREVMLANSRITVT